MPGEGGAEFSLERKKNNTISSVFVLCRRKRLRLWGSFPMSAFSPWATVSKMFPSSPHVADDTGFLSRMPED